MTALFASVPPTEHSVHCAIDAKVRTFDIHQLQALLKAAGLQRVSRLVSIVKQTVHQARADWPRVLQNAPPNLKRAVIEWLEGAVTLAQ